MTRDSTNQHPRSVTEPDRPSDIDRMDDQLKNEIQPEQDIQPEEGTLRSPREEQVGRQTRGGGNPGTERV